MKFLKNNISYNSNDLYLDNNFNSIYNFEKTHFVSIKIFIQVTVACIYAFGLGFSLFYLGTVIKNGLVFLALLALSFLIIIILYELSHILFYPNKDKDKVTICYSLLPLAFFSCFDDSISKGRALSLLVIPFIILAIFPTIASYLLGFNLFLYAFASAGAIKTSTDLLNLILILKNVPQDGVLKICGYDFYLESIQKKKSLEISESDISSESI